MLIPIFAVVIAVGGLTAVLLSPFVLLALDQIEGLDWVRLSAIGETYGAASAVLAALALSGVVASLFYQGRQVNVQHAQAQRQFHMELMKLGLQEPQVYMDSLDPIEYSGRELTIADKKRHVYINLFVNNMLMSHRLGQLPDAELRYYASKLFKGEPARHYWEGAKDAWSAGGGGSSKRRRFFAIFDEEYNRAVLAGPPLPTITDVHGNNDRAVERSQFGRDLAYGLVGGVLVAAGALIAAGIAYGRDKAIRPVR